jgi:hypothetical protein
MSAVLSCPNCQGDLGPHEDPEAAERGWRRCAACGGMDWAMPTEICSCCTKHRRAQLTEGDRARICKRCAHGSTGEAPERITTARPCAQCGGYVGHVGSVPTAARGMGLCRKCASVYRRAPKAALPQHPCLGCGCPTRAMSGYCQGCKRARWSSPERED